MCARTCPVCVQQNTKTVSGKRKRGQPAVLDEVFEVEAVLKRKRKGGKYLYWVQWKGYPGN